MDKEAYRKEIKARIASLSSVYIDESNRAIFENLIALPEFIASARVFTYLSIGREPDTRALIEHCGKLGKTVAIPFEYKKDGLMSFALLDRHIGELEEGAYGIPTLPDSAERLVPQEGDIMIVPALCYDKSGYRLGRGGGYYDRYLAGHRVFSAGLCREELFVNCVPRESYDMRVNCIITDKRIARPDRPRK